MRTDNFTEESIPTGSYVIGKKDKKTLIAHLGSCVGVLLIDEQNEVGGLYHILLPAPTQANLAHISYNFASAGMPNFIEEFVGHGADLKSTKAVIAGGALLGAISQVDLELDIGGRTSETVTQVLNQKSIPIHESITGGYFACTLELDLSNLEYKVENIGAAKSSRQELINMAQDIDVDTAITRLRPVPQVALKISRMLNSDDFSMKQIAKEIRNDQIISAKVIQLCNSSFMGLKSRVSSVDQAIVLIGEKMLIKIVLQSSLELFYQDIEKGYSLTKGGLYYHAMATATVAEQIANITKKVKPDIAYTAGLLHDIGKIVLDQFIAQVFPTFFDRIFNEKEDLISVEENLLGIDHTAAGKRLAELWKLPEILREAIEYHHNPEKAVIKPELTHVVYLSDLIISRFHTGIEIDRLNTNNFSERLAVLGLKSDGFLDLVNSISWEEILN